jgi:hypothetical protein
MLSNNKLNPLLKRTRILLGVLACSSFVCGPVSAQRADVPATDRSGNFRSTRMQGNRGVYQQTYWLVVDRDPAGLNCRNSKFRSRGPSLQKQEVTLQPGAIIKADHYALDDDAISIVEGETWLRVIVNQAAMQYDGRRQERDKPYQCYVRANASFIAPINISDLRETPKW